MWSLRIGSNFRVTTILSQRPQKAWIPMIQQRGKARAFKSSLNLMNKYMKDQGGTRRNGGTPGSVRI